MQRIPTTDIDSAPEASRPLLEQVNASFGTIPNIFATVAHSPATFRALMGMLGALEDGALGSIAHEAIALRVGELHGCDYCRAAHTAKANMLGVSAKDTISFRQGEANDPKVRALLSLATNIIEKRGQVSDGDVRSARDAGISDAELLETLTVVLTNTFTNYINALVKTEVDFPAAPVID
jgi:uncharacterized peroxidase-related enzyme